MNTGDRVWYLQHLAGGYGWSSHHVPATIVAHKRRRVTIDAEHRDGHVSRVHVSAYNLIPRLDAPATAQEPTP
jgi:hypothetical protein